MNPLLVLLIVLLVFFVLMQLFPLLRARAMKGQIAPSLEGVIDPARAGDKDLLIYFHSASCGPCRSMSETIDRLRAEGQPIAKVDVSTARDVAQRFKVMATPTLLRIHEGRIDTVRLGAQSERAIRSLLD